MRAVIDGADDAQLPWAVVDRGCITLLERADPQPAPRAAGEQCSMAAAVSVVVQVAGAAATASPRVTSDAARGAPGPCAG